MDSVAPAKLRRVPKKSSTPLLNEELIALRKSCRKMERQWRHSGLEVHLQAWRDNLKTFQTRMSAAKAAYYSSVIMKNRNNSRLLFDTVSRLTEQQNEVGCTDLTAEDFLLYFTARVEDIRSKIPQCLNTEKIHSASVSTLDSQGFSEFEPITLCTLTKVVKAARPTTCLFDPMLAWVFKELWSTLGPYVLCLVNQSISSGVFPACFRTAVVRPLLKKPGLDNNLMANYRPISNLPF